jgi:hypothetical protein
VLLVLVSPKFISVSTGGGTEAESFLSESFLVRQFTRKYARLVTIDIEKLFSIFANTCSNSLHLLPISYL